MIVIQQSGFTSTVILELIQSASGSTPIYLFDFIKKGTTTIKSFISEDISTVPCRYQKFLINNISGDPLNGEIYLLGGEYDYIIYQIDSLSLSANKIKKLQSGLVYVEGISNSIYS